MKWNFLRNFFGNLKIESSENDQQHHELDVQTLDTKVILDRAKRKFLSRKYEEAMDDINLLLSIDPNNIHAYMERSKIKSKQGDSIGSKEDLDQAGLLLKKLDKGLKAYQKGISKYNEQDFNGSLKYFNDAITNGIETGQIYYLRGMSKSYIDDFKGASIDLSRVIDSFPEYEEIFEAYFTRGKIRYHKLENYDGALEDFNEAIILKPTLSEVYVSRAILKNSNGDKVGAMNDYNKAIELDPRNGGIYFSRALLNMDHEKYLDSINDLDSVIRLGLSDDYSLTMFDAYSLRGTSKVLLSDYEEALEDFDKSIELEPENGKAYANRSEVYLFLGKNQLAMEDKFSAVKLGYIEE